MGARGAVHRYRDDLDRVGGLIQMADWTYRVPTVRGTRWEARTGSIYAFDKDWPTLGIYCSAESHDLWLIGMFELDAEVSSRFEKPHWSWRDTYPTGDGQLIALRRQARKDGVEPSQRFLVGDRVYDRGASKRRLEAAVESQDQAALEEASRLDDAEQAAMRSRPALECLGCGDRIVRRSELLPATLGRIWAAGVREMSMTMLRRALTAANG